MGFFNIFSETTKNPKLQTTSASSAAPATGSEKTKSLNLQAESASFAPAEVPEGVPYITRLNCVGKGANELTLKVDDLVTVLGKGIRGNHGKILQLWVEFDLLTHTQDGGI